MIPVYETKTIRDMSPQVRELTTKLNALVQEMQERGCQPGDFLNIFINAVANFARAYEVDRAAVEDALKTCLDAVAGVPPERFFKPREEKTEGGAS